MDLYSISFLFSSAGTNAIARSTQNNALIFSMSSMDYPIPTTRNATPEAKTPVDNPLSVSCVWSLLNLLQVVVKNLPIKKRKINKAGRPRSKARPINKLCAPKSPFPIKGSFETTVAIPVPNQGCAIILSSAFFQIKTRH